MSFSVYRSIVWRGCNKESIAKKERLQMERLEIEGLQMEGLQMKGLRCVLNDDASQLWISPFKSWPHYFRNHTLAQRAYNGLPL